MHLIGAVRDIVVFAAHFAHLGNLVGGHGNVRTNTKMVVPGPLQANVEEVVAVVGVVTVHHDIVRTAIAQHDINVAILICIEAGDTPALAVIDQSDLFGAFVESGAVGRGVVEKTNGDAPVILLPFPLYILPSH